MSFANNNEFNALMENEQFVKEMLSAENAEQVQKLYADNGVELTIEEVQEIGKILNTLDSDGELNEDSLDGVSGGSLALGWAIAKAVIGVGSAALAVYKWYKSTK